MVYSYLSLYNTHYLRVSKIADLGDVVHVSGTFQAAGSAFLAAQAYRNLLVVWPQTGAFSVGLGGALEGQNLQKEAVECYQRALKTETLREDLLA